MSEESHPDHKIQSPQSDESSASATEDQPKIVLPLEFSNGKKKSGCSSFIGFLMLLCICVVLVAILVPNYLRARSGGQLPACKSNLKNIGTALEMYSTDWSGKYPTAMAQLTPNYLRVLLECPSAGSMTYQLHTGTGAAYNTKGYEDYYFVSCSDTNHSAIGLNAGYPQYDSISGLIER